MLCPSSSSRQIQMDPKEINMSKYTRNISKSFVLEIHLELTTELIQL